MFVNLCKINSCRKRAIFFFVTYNKCDLLTSWYFWVDVICNVGMVKGSLLLLSLVNKGFSHLGERKGMLKVLEGGRFNLKNFCVCMEKCERRGSELKSRKTAVVIIYERSLRTNIHLRASKYKEFEVKVWYALPNETIFFQKIYGLSGHFFSAC